MRGSRKFFSEDNEIYNLGKEIHVDLKKNVRHFETQTPIENMY